MTNLPFSSLSVDGFRNIRKLNIDKLGCFNVLVGGNNSGKTSLLEAISLLCRPCHPEEWQKMINRRDFGELDENRLQSIRWCFYKKSPVSEEAFADSTCTFTSNGKFSLRKLEVSYKEYMAKVKSNDDPLLGLMTLEQEPSVGSSDVRAGILTYQPHFSDENLDVFIPTKKNYSKTFWEIEYLNSTPLRRSRPPVAKRQIQYEFLTPYSYQINRLQVRRLSANILSEQNRFVSMSLLKDFDENIEDLQILSIFGSRPAIYIKHHKYGFSPLSTFGDAMRRIVLWAITLTSFNHGGVLLIDEFEVGLHVGNLNKVLPWLVSSAKKLDVQVFITTHSLEALDALVEACCDQDEEDEDIVVFHLDQKDSGTQVKRFAGGTLRRLRFERGLDLR